MHDCAFSKKRGVESGLTTGEISRRNSRASGEMFIDPDVSIDYRQSGAKWLPFRSALDTGNQESARHHKYFVPTVLWVAAALLIANLSILSVTAQAQRRTAASTTASIPSPQSVFGFNPGDERTIVDWKQITDY